VSCLTPSWPAALAAHALALQVAALRPFKAAADLLAAKADWPPLYDPDALQVSRVPFAAATYLEDMYVDYGLAQETLECVPNVRQWVTNEFKHRCGWVGCCGG
jgi:hypothetical protein